MICVLSVAETVGFGLTRIALVAALWQPVLVDVNLKVAVPFEIPVTTPSLETVAMASLLLTHVPPMVGDKVTVEPIQIVPPPPDTEGLGFTVILNVIGVPVHKTPLLVEGVTLIVATISVVPVLTALNGLIVPVPLAAKPMVG
jgi:hypothetical protein